MSGTAASAKVWRRIGIHARDALLRDLPGADLKAILADIARTRAAAMTPADLISRWREEPVLLPSTTDPKAALACALELYDKLPQEFRVISLSPVMPVGAGVHLGGRGQNRVITTMRGTELLADPVHGLALEASRRRRSGQSRVHLATHARATHGWEHEDRHVHTLRFSLCSSAPDSGGLHTEAELLDLHLDYWREVLGEMVPRGRVQLVVWDATLASHLAERGTVDDLIVVEGRDRSPWSNPYATAAFRMVVDGEEQAELGDGGFVPWTQMLTRNRKDRCLVSGVDVDEVVTHGWSAR